MKLPRSLTAVAVAAATFSASPALFAEEAGSEGLTVDDVEPDTGRLAAGIAVTSAGGLAALGGGVAYMLFNAQPPADPSCRQCDPYKQEKTGSILALVLGGAAIGVGVPLMFTADDVALADAKKKRRSLPEVRVGVGGGSLTWQF